MRNLFFIFTLLVSSINSWAADYQEGIVLAQYDKSSELTESEVKEHINTATNEAGEIITINITDEGLGLWSIKIENISTEKAVEIFAKIDGIKWAEPNYIFNIQSDNNTTYNYRSGAAKQDMQDQMWGLNNTEQTVNINTAEGEQASGANPGPGTNGKDISAHNAWNIQDNCYKVPVAVIDSGVNYLHRDLKNSIWINTSETSEIDLNTSSLGNLDGDDSDGNGYIDDAIGWDFVANDNAPIPKNGHDHGTHVAGIINSVCNEQAAVMPLRTLLARTGNVLDVHRAILYATTHTNTRIINLSLGDTSSSIGNALLPSLQQANDQGILIIAAAGNNSKDNDAIPTYPCSLTLDNLICVAAVDATFDLSDFSNYGAQSVDIAAPGSNIISTAPGKTVVRNSDTNNYMIIDELTNTTNNIAHAGLYYIHSSISPAGSLLRLDIYEASADTATYDPTDISYVNCQNNIISPCISSTLNLPMTAYNNTGIHYVYELDNCINNICIAFFNDDTGTSASIDITMQNADTFKVLSGTSMAAPHVSGIAALVMARNPLFTATDVKAAILNSATTQGIDYCALEQKTVTCGVANAEKALQYVTKPKITSIEII